MEFETFKEMFNNAFRDVTAKELKQKGNLK